MTTFQFLADFIRDGATVTIVDSKHDILYTGAWDEMSFGIIKNTRFTILGIGDESDLMLQVTPIER